MLVHFSDWFKIEPETLEDYGAFNASLINDLPVFIDPFLLFTSDKKEYQELHARMISYLRFLRDQSANGPLEKGLLRAWFMFPEVEQLWLGFSAKGNKGNGLGMDFAVALNRSLNLIFKSFGDEEIARGSHLEKLCLIQSGVGRDNISDFTANLIKDFLAEYTQSFAQKNIRKSLRRKVSIKNTRFDSKTCRWCPETFELPFINGDYVLLSPRDILTKDDNWINRQDFLHRFEDIANSTENERLRSEVNQYLVRMLKDDSTSKERHAAYWSILHKRPELIEWYIRSKEDHGEEAKAESLKRVADIEERLITQVRQLVRRLAVGTEFYETAGNTLEECRARIEFLKHEIEHNTGWRLFYHQGKPIQRESDLQILFRLTWFATPSDFNSEVNNGRGPVDFKISRGNGDKSIVEFKLAKNSHLEQNLANQIGVYEKANRTKNSLKVIFYFSDEEKDRVAKILKLLKLEDNRSIVQIDCRQDNKPSASYVRTSKRNSAQKSERKTRK